MSNIRLGIQGHDLFVIVEGRGTAEYCSELNALFQSVLAENTIDRVFFDTQNAVFVDSSFIGLILLVKKKFNSSKDIVFLLNPSEKVLEIFKIMGLDSFIPAIFDPNLYCEQCYITVNQKLENAVSDIKLLLESHRNIMETSSENKKRFALVEKVFQKELEKKQYSN